MKKCLLIWDTSIAEMLYGGVFGGIAVQLNLWAKIFIEHGWNVYALTTRKSFTKNKITFLKVKKIKGFNLILEWYNIHGILGKIKPTLIFLRGAQRALYPLNIIGDKYGSKVIFFGASDINFDNRKASVGSPLNRLLYDRGLRMTKKIVSQNEYQYSELINNYGIKSLTLFNIWDKTNFSILPKIQFDAIWVSNFRKLKRAEWFCRLAVKHPHYNFCIVGGSTSDPSYYHLIENTYRQTTNLEFKGKLSLEETSYLVASSKVLICTSEYEGFPNTFLQAMAASKPIISTVDPSNILSRYHLGIVVKTEKEMEIALKSLLTNSEIYESIKSNIQDFFTHYINSTSSYRQLIKYIYNL